jgi:isoquinoline 1-oxidoreductase subunit alpha
MTDITVNGTVHHLDGDPETPLLWYLRDQLGLLSTRFGCGAALYGCCTVHANDVATRSCTTRIRYVEGKHITTIEGLSANGLDPLQEAWIEIEVPQCGYCQSGQMMRAAALLSMVPNPTDEEIDQAMSGNICRCGTYPRIRAA